MAMFNQGDLVTVVSEREMGVVIGEIPPGPIDYSAHGGVWAVEIPNANGDGAVQMIVGEDMDLLFSAVELTDIINTSYSIVKEEGK